MQRNNVKWFAAFLGITLIADQLADDKEQYTTNFEARQKPHVLDDYTVQRVIHVYTEQLEFIWVFEQQLSKWLTEERLTPIQQSKIDQLRGQLQHLKHVLTDILTLAEELKRETIEKVTAKSDFEMGIEF